MFVRLILGFRSGRGKGGARAEKRRSVRRNGGLVTFTSGRAIIQREVRNTAFVRRANSRGGLLVDGPGRENCNGCRSSTQGRSSGDGAQSHQVRCPVAQVNDGRAIPGVQAERNRTSLHRPVLE